MLGKWSDAVTGHPYIVLAIAFFLAAAAIYITVIGLPVGKPGDFGPLGFQSDRNDLLSRELDWNQRFITWNELFEGINDLIVIVDAWGSDGQAEPGDDARARALVDDLGETLLASEATQQVVWRFGPDDADPSAMRLMNMEDFRRQLADIAQSQMMLTSDTPEALFGQVNAEIRREAAGLAEVSQEDETQAVAGLGDLRRMVEAMTTVLATPADEPVDFAAAMQQAGGEAAAQWQYFQSENGRHYYIRVTPTLEKGTISAAENAIAATRAIIAEVSARHPGVEVGLTGVEVVEADETQVATFDGTVSSIIATVVITFLLIMSFHSWRVPVMAMISLLVGIAWSFGYLTLAIGHLQVLSVVFAVILLGLGIAFGIHLATRLEMVRHTKPDTTEGFVEAMRDAFQTMGPGMITGAVTTAAAFLMMTFTKFNGLAEMGEIAAAGIILCLIAMLTVFPALLRRYKRRHRHIFPISNRRWHVFSESWVMPFAKHPLRTLGGIGIATAAALYGASHIRFDYNLLNMLPHGVDSVEWQRRLINDGGRTLWFAVSIVDDLQTARELTAKYRELDIVDEVGGVGLLFPRDEAEKKAMIAEVRQTLEPALSAAVRGEAASPAATPATDAPATPLPGAVAPGAISPTAGQPELVQQMAAVRAFFTFARLAPARQRPTENVLAAMDGVSRAIGRAITLLSELPTDEQTRRIERLRTAWAQWRQDSARQIDAALSTQPLTLDALPESIRGMYHAPEAGKYALEIYPNLPDGLTDPLEPEFLRDFVTQLEAIDPNLTGASPQFHKSGDLIWDSYQLAGALAVLAVFILVLIDFGSVWDALLSLAPVVIGFIWTLGIMAVMGLDLNPANIMVLPLVFGIGVDSGVHIIHRFRQDGVSRPLGLTGGTGKAITITSLTAIIGFASMIPARHLGIRSLGITLSLAIGMVLLACWILMPAWLEIRSRRQKA